MTWEHAGVILLFDYVGKKILGISNTVHYKHMGLNWLYIIYLFITCMSNRMVIFFFFKLNNIQKEMFQYVVILLRNQEEAKMCFFFFFSSSIALS